jgi:hypothetical protein
MSAIRGSAHSKYPCLLPIEPRDDFLCLIDLEPEPIDLKPERIDLTPEDVLFPNWEPSAHKRPRVLARFPIAFCTGVAGAWLWLSYGDAAREMNANSYRQLGWFAPRPALTAQNPHPTDVIGRAAGTAQVPRQRWRIQSGGLRCAGVVSLSASAEMPRGLHFGKPHQISVSPGAPDEQTIRLLVDVTCSVGK